MTKKRLSDLLRNEVEKSAEAADVSSQKEAVGSSVDQAVVASATPSADPAPSTKSSAKLATEAQSRRSKNTSSATASKLQSKITELEAELKTVRQQESSWQKQIGALKTELQQQVDKSDQLTADLAQMKGAVEQHAELKAKLEAARQQETSWQEQIDKLKVALQQQIDLSVRLTTDLERAKGQVDHKETELDRVAAELNEAKKMILQLSEVNAKPLAKAPPLGPPTAAQKPTYNRSQRVGLKPLPQYCIQSEPKSTAFTDDDIGWVD